MVPKVEISLALHEFLVPANVISPTLPIAARRAFNKAQSGTLLFQKDFFCYRTSFVIFAHEQK